MINVLFFAQVREWVGTDSLQVTETFSHVEALRESLCLRGERWALALEPDKLLVAVNQTLVDFSHQIQDGDEVAFFPPVTGG
ncbi:molybdopterin synthase sulfur carrier subunit [Rouxiella sp. Mn2063]|uniref:molybdopterin synthase sulfur carrier subunit n=1 Tax=Rouxiella sp. Mn2063 TaxID=3395262 RepID=UPI003BE5DF74